MTDNVTQLLTPSVRHHKIKARAEFLRIAATNFLDGTYDTAVQLEALGVLGTANVLDAVVHTLLAEANRLDAEAAKLMAPAAA